MKAIVRGANGSSLHFEMAPGDAPEYIYVNNRPRPCVARHDDYLVYAADDEDFWVQAGGDACA